ncbi:MULTISPECIES: putative transporter small subunit [Nesterenkonia]|uniref:Uncharacterized protein n=2 Tax=Nesterenkonia TaxID=57494 RepID=A0A839FFR9_9MICC|nr:MULTISPECIES: putative transporter small subunit [Nesterenkonia]MBA8920538.1 hypothetical protein [Nesterenkonia jeotgali]NYJ17887.1 hypothetical protein [Nesterenkonia sandarakina]
MSTLALTLYTLMWPMIVLVVMGVIGYAFFTDFKEARRSGKDII